jgi:site-specific DNA-methyltransferase (adenine-specific)
MIPESIPFDSVVVGERGRRTYSGIEGLAENIRNNGLVQPLVLDVNLNLVAGGRRHKALQHLGVVELFHATTSDPERPGFVLKGEDEKSTLSNLLTEIAENLHRDELDWVDKMRMIVRAYKLVKSEAHAKGEDILMQDFGAMMDCGYADVYAAVMVFDDYTSNPERYENVNSVQGAYKVLIEENKKYVASLAATKSLTTVPLYDKRSEAPVDASQKQELLEGEPQIIPITRAFRNLDGLEFLRNVPSDSFDHVITDPDYAVDVELLSSNSETAASGVAHSSIEHSLQDLTTFLVCAYNVIKPQGFCVFFYDLDHHEKLQRLATEVGFRVQRWPLIWKKTDFRSNASPQHNFCKNIEYAMVCRKPNATLVQAQMSSVYECGSLSVTKELGHPFAKPYDLWRWIYDAVAIKGQVVCDPFVGSGSSAISAARCGLRPVGCEINTDWYNLLLLNLQREYRRLLGDNITFV